MKRTNIITEQLAGKESIKRNSKNNKKKSRNIEIKEDEGRGCEGR